MAFDVLIVGGGPAGLSAALQLGRARRSVLLCDSGPRRNAAAEHIHGFATRDGITPAEFRRVGRQQLEPYTGVEVRDVGVEEIRGERGGFDVRLATGEVEVRRILLCTGMIDELPEIDGFRELWGRSIFQCPFCHGWELQGRRFGFLASGVETLDFAFLLRGWTSDVAVLSNGAFTIPPEVRTRLADANVRIEERRIARLAGSEGLERVELVDGSSLDLDVLFARPRQRQVVIVESLGPELDAGGYVRADENRETSIPGIYAAGDLITPQQNAVIAAAAGAQAAGRLFAHLAAELAANGALS